MLFFFCFFVFKKREKRNDSSINSLHIWQFFMLLMLSVNFFSKLTFSKNSFRNTSAIKVSNSFDPDQAWSGSKLYAKLYISRRQNSPLTRVELIMNEINSAVLHSRNKIHSYHGLTLSSWKSSIHPFHNPLCILPKANTSKLSSIHFKQRITATRTSLIDRQLPNNKYLYRISEARTL